MRYLLGLIFLLPLAARAETITIEKGACELVTRHVPSPDVEYQPGVDAEGRAVAPADLTPPLQLPQTITIPVTAYLARDLGIPARRLSGTQATIGIIRVEGNKAYFNGQPLQPELEENLAVLCMKANKSGTGNSYRNAVSIP